MSEAARLIANHRVHVVPVVLALANPPWQQDVWLDPSAFEDLDHVFHTLFDDFCDADEPEQYLDATACHVHTFAEMMNARTGHQLPGWIEKVQADDLPELRLFVNGVRSDQSAVTARLG